MTAKHIQYLLGVIFLILGLWALAFPAHVEGLVLSPEHFIGSTSSAVLIGCFGAQAILCAVLILSTTFKAQTFLLFGLIGSLPFFVFNYYFVFIVPVFNQWMIIDFAGNLGILLCGIAGWQIKQREENAVV